MNVFILWVHVFSKHWEKQVFFTHHASGSIPQHLGKRRLEAASPPDLPMNRYVQEHLPPPLSSRKRHLHHSCSILSPLVDCHLLYLQVRPLSLLNSHKDILIWETWSHSVELNLFRNKETEKQCDQNSMRAAVVLGSYVVFWRKQPRMGPQSVLPTSTCTRGTYEVGWSNPQQWQITLRGRDADLGNEPEMLTVLGPV